MAKYLIQLTDARGGYLNPATWTEVAAETPQRAAANGLLYFSRLAPIELPAYVAVAHADGPKHENGAPKMAHVMTLNALPEGKGRKAD